MCNGRPDIRPPDWTVIGEGFGAVVWRSTDGLSIARVARTSMAGSAIASQVRWLPYLVPRLPIDVPRLHSWVQPGEDARYPNGAMVYGALPGQPLASSDISPKIEKAPGAFLATLHAVPVPSETSPMTWRADLIARRNRTYTPVRGVLRQRLTPAAFTRVEAWQQGEPPTTPRPVIVHGDFWYENILIDPGSGQLTGVIDWEAVGIGHPAQDLVTLRYLSAAVADRITRMYSARTGRDLETLQRDMRWFWEARDFGGIASAIEMQDDAELEDATRELREGPILAD